MSPTFRSLFVSVHFLRVCRMGRYSSSARTRQRGLAPVSTVCCSDPCCWTLLGVVRLPLTEWESFQVTIWRVTLSVHKILWVSWMLSYSRMASKICLDSPISRFQDPPIWDAWGGLNTHEQFCSLKNLCTVTSGSLWLNPSSFAAATKFVPQSDLICLPIITK